MGTLIDSSVLIAWERNQLNLEDQLADSAGHALATRGERSFPKISGLNLLRWRPKLPAANKTAASVVMLACPSARLHDLNSHR